MNERRNSMCYGYREVGPGPGENERSDDSDGAERLLPDRLCCDGMSQKRSMASTGDGVETTSARSDFIVNREFMRDARCASVMFFSRVFVDGASIGDAFGVTLTLPEPT